MKDLLKNKSIVDVEKALTTKSMCKVEENWFPLDRKLVSTSGNKVFLQKLEKKKKSVNKRILFLLNRKSGPTDRNIGKIK